MESYAWLQYGRSTDSLSQVYLRIIMVKSYYVASIRGTLVQWHNINNYDCCQALVNNYVYTKKQLYWQITGENM